MRECQILKGANVNENDRGSLTECQETKGQQTELELGRNKNIDILKHRCIKTGWETLKKRVKQIY